jgi:phosphomannomutase
MFVDAVSAGLRSIGVAVIDCGLIPTPTAQLAVEHHQAAGGIIVTASHNPVEWNALKFVGSDGLFLDQGAVAELFQLVDGGALERASWDRIGAVSHDDGSVDRHLAAVLALPYVDVDRIRERGVSVVLDCVRGAGGTIMPALLDRLGCQVVGVDLATDGRFPRAPEPVPSNLGGLAEAVRRHGAEVGMAVDPDADRLALVDESGIPIGEDYTLALAVRAVLERRVGPVAVNLSTSLVVDDAARPFGVTVARAPVGEANVARAMQMVGAVIGGEGNGGVMLPELHLGRDAPLAGNDLKAVYAKLEAALDAPEVDRQDGLRLSWPDRWLHVRPSGTEPIVRLIAEAPSADAANAMISAGRKLLQE